MKLAIRPQFFQIFIRESHKTTLAQICSLETSLYMYIHCKSGAPTLVSLVAPITPIISVGSHKHRFQPLQLTFRSHLEVPGGTITRVPDGTLSNIGHGHDQFLPAGQTPGLRGLNSIQGYQCKTLADRLFLLSLSSAHSHQPITNFRILANTSAGRPFVNISAFCSSMSTLTISNPFSFPISSLNQ